MKSSNFPCILLLKPKERTVQNMSIILKTTNLCKSFNGQTAVNNISLNIERNSIYGLLGPNGAGKSTTLKMITGILRPTSGSIEFDGHANTSIGLLTVKDRWKSPIAYRLILFLRKVCFCCFVRIEILKSVKKTFAIFKASLMSYISSPD